MINMKSFWENYYNRPVGQIPWNKSQADWFEKLIANGKIKGNTALDIGCGVGYKSIYLAEVCGFSSIVGVDISGKAIKIAQKKCTE